MFARSLLVQRRRIAHVSQWFPESTGSQQSQRLAVAASAERIAKQAPFGSGPQPLVRAAEHPRIGQDRVAHPVTPVLEFHAHQLRHDRERTRVSRCGLLPRHNPHDVRFQRKSQRSVQRTGSPLVRRNG